MENKMGTMPMPKLMITMSLPIMISMLVQALYNIVDSMFVARLSQDALAAVSLCYPVQTIMIAIACGTGVGFNTLLSRCLGERNTDKANQVVLHGLMIALVNWLLFVVLGFLLARPFLMLFSGQENVIDMGVVYLQICNTLSFGIFIQITYERILGDRGHLSNEAGAELAWTAVEGGARTVVLAHLSHENNTPARAHEVVRGVLERRGAAVGRDVALEVAPRSEKSRRYTV